MQIRRNAKLYNKFSSKLPCLDLNSFYGMKQVLRNQLLQPYSYEYTDFSEASNFE